MHFFLFISYQGTRNETLTLQVGQAESCIQNTVNPDGIFGATESLFFSFMTTSTVVSGNISVAREKGFKVFQTILSDCFKL